MFSTIEIICENDGETRFVIYSDTVLFFASVANYWPVVLWNIRLASSYLSISSLIHLLDALVITILFH